MYSSPDEFAFNYLLLIEHQINTLVLQMMERTPHLTVANISAIMRHSETASLTRNKVLSQLRRDDIGIYDAVEDILFEWVGRKSYEATLKALVTYLVKVNMRSHADAMKALFKL